MADHWEPGLTVEILADPLKASGPPFIGLLLAYFLFGILVVQVFLYYQTVAKYDRPAMRWLVALVLFIQTLALVFTTHVCWNTHILSFIDPVKMVEPPTTALTTTAMNGVIAFVVQTFFAWRLRSLAPKSVIATCLAVSIVLMSVIQLVGAWGAGITFLAIARKNQELAKLKVWFILQLAFNVSGDIVITLGMIGILAYYRENTSFTRTKSLLNTLIVNTIENGLITSVCATINLFVYFLSPDTLYNILFQYLIGGLYAIVFQTTVNRKRVLAKTDVSTSISLSENPSFSARGGTGMGTGRAPYSLNVIGHGQRSHGGASDSKTTNDMMISVSTEVHQDAYDESSYVKA